MDTQQRENQSSTIMIFSASLFAIPAMLLHTHGFIVNSLLTWMVFSMSLVFHRHNVESVMNPNPILRCTDIVSTASACTAIIVYGHNHLSVMLPACGVPGFYIWERLVMYKNGNDGSQLCGPAGIHSLLHVSAIISSCCLAFTGSNVVPIESDIETVCFGFIVGCLFSTIFQPRKNPPKITTNGMITSILGVAKNKQ